MNKRINLLFLVFLIISISCKLSENQAGPTPTPLPGWRSPVHLLMIDDSDFPDGWEMDYFEEESTDPTINLVWRTWGRSGIPGTLMQTISRAYSVEDAQAFYRKFQSSYTPTSSPFDDVFIPFVAPSEIEFRSLVADEWRFACGWITLPYCLLSARYRNYVTVVRFDLEREHVQREDEYTYGLTYEEIEGLLKALNEKFVEFLELHPLDS